MQPCASIAKPTAAPARKHSNARRPAARRCATQAISVENNAAGAAQSNVQDPLMLRAIKGEEIERPPIWMMRQAGRYMKVYQDLVKKYPTFKERSEQVDLAV